MDALPIEEQTDEAFASSNGAMHACGHDLHTAALAGAAMLLSARRDALTGDVIFMFQPGEEGHAGARHMIDEGLLQAAGRIPDAAYGLHVLASELPAGVFATRPGPFMAAADDFHLTVTGHGGHAGTPHLARDPVPVICEIVTALQTVIARQCNPYDPVVLTVGHITAGTRSNIIPDTAYLEATIRSFTPDARDQVKAAVNRACTSIANAHGMHAHLEWIVGYPATINDPTEEAFVGDMIRTVLGDHRHHTLPHPHAGNEDFSFVLEQVPGCFVFLGTCPTSEPATAPSNHSAKAQFDDRWLADAASVLAELASRRMARA